MRRSKERGSQLVEFAVVLPLLLFICMGAIEGGSMLRVQQLLNNAAREGTRMAVTQDIAMSANRDSIIQTVVSSYLTNNNALPANGARFTLGQCSSWNANTNVVTTWPFQVGGTLPSSGAITGTLTLAGGQTVDTFMARVSVSCTYQFFFVPRLPSLSVQPNVTVAGQATMMNLY